jgi:hypothetical protein
MNPVGKALWFIKSHFASEITLEGIAKIGGVSLSHDASMNIPTAERVLIVMRLIAFPRLCQ